MSSFKKITVVLPLADLWDLTRAMEGVPYLAKLSHQAKWVRSKRLVFQKMNRPDRHRGDQRPMKLNMKVPVGEETLIAIRYPDSVKRFREAKNKFSR